jgi:hypothetical protein
LLIVSKDFFKPIIINLFPDQNCSCCIGDSTVETNKYNGINNAQHSSHKGRGGGGKRHPHKHPLYTGPLVRSMNHSKLFVNVGDNTSLRIEVCSNPRAHRIYWIAPNFRSLKIGGREKDIKVDNLVATKVTDSTVRVTCVQSQLYISNFGWQDEGEYTLIAKNRYGFDGDSIVVKIAGGVGRRKQRSKEKETKSSRNRNSEQMSQINAASTNVKTYSFVSTFAVSMAIYCFSIVRFNELFFFFL